MKSGYPHKNDLARAAGGPSPEGGALAATPEHKAWLETMKTIHAVSTFLHEGWKAGEREGSPMHKLYLSTYATLQKHAAAVRATKEYQAYAALAERVGEEQWTIGPDEKGAWKRRDKEAK